jgi:excisionase family DNA binding protein
METIQIQNISYPQVIEDFAALLENALTKQATAKEPEELLTPQDVAETFHVSLPTVHAWANEGILIRHKIGTRTYFKRSQVMAAVKPVHQ